MKEGGSNRLPGLVTKQQRLVNNNGGSDLVKF